MKIKTEDAIYHIPVNSGICSIASSHLNDFIDCLESYFTNKKKNKCAIMDEEDDIIKPGDIEFIYIPHDEDLLQIFEFKPKTLLNNEICDYIDNNQEKFTSIDKIRNLVYDLLTDAGMYDLLRIMKNNMSIDINMSIDDFDVARLLQMLAIKVDTLDIQERFIILYNLMLYKNRNKYCVVYIDFDVDDKTANWIKKISDINKLILINNESILTNSKDYLDNMLILSSNNFVEVVEEYKENLNNLIYCFHPYILRNVDQQNEKNIRIINKYLDKQSTFLIKFTSLNTI